MTGKGMHLSRFSRLFRQAHQHIFAHFATPLPTDSWKGANHGKGEGGLWSADN